MAQTIKVIIGLRSSVVAAKSDIDDMITYAKSKIQDCGYGEQYNDAIALLVLHLYEVNDRGAGGPITSETEARLSRSYAATASSSSWGDTKWGRELQTLSSSIHFGPRNRRMPTCQDLS